MEENVVLQVILHEESGIEIHLGNSQKINPLMLIGILEQVKLNLLSNAQMEEVSETPVTNQGKYDA
jgi:hypothetical protein